LLLSLSVFVKLEVLTAVTMKITIFWNVTPCSLVDIEQYFLTKIIFIVVLIVIIIRHSSPRH
jgi:hypothetical protein